MNHEQLINYIISKKGYKSYLEIGTESGNNFEHINIEDKECCDVVKIYDKLTYHMPSDEMFAQMDVNKKYDIIFIDGMHDEEYVDRDIVNSLRHLNPGGIICIHDVLPTCAAYQVTYELYDHNMPWTGNVWKSITKLQDNNLEFYTVVNNDWGLTIIKYKDNPHALRVPLYNSKIRYDYIFNNTGNYETCLTNQGRYVLHAISEDQLDLIL